MSQPTFARRRPTRRHRLTRTVIVGVVLAAVAALIVGRLGGESEEEPPTPTVAFTTSARAETDVSKAAGADALATEREALTQVLDSWFQTAFVDPAKFGDGTFSDVEQHFAADAREQFRADLATLTIGEARTEVERVVPEVARARFSIFFAGADEPKYAIGKLTFSARATMKEEAALPLRIVLTGTFTFEKRDRWVVTYYEAKQTQRSISPSPSPSPSR